jgi:transposase
MWENGLSYCEASACFNIRDQCAVSKWERAYEAGGVAALRQRQCGRPRKMPDSEKPVAPPLPDDARSREDLLAENKQLRMEVAFLKKLEALDQAKRAALRKKRK